MKKSLKTRLASIALALGVITGGGLVAAPAASAMVMYEQQVRQCHWVHVYTVYDYNWWEETFYGKRDTRKYVYSYYSYSPTCGSIRV